MKANRMIPLLATIALTASIGLAQAPPARYPGTPSPATRSGQVNPEVQRTRARTADGTCDGTQQGRLNKNGERRGGKALGPQDGSGQRKGNRGGRQGGRG